MQQYLDLVRLIHHTGNFKSDRTGTGTYSIFGHQMRFNLSEGFPLVTAKHTHLKSIIHELLWFLQGETNIRYLKANGVRIWDEWVKEETAEYRPATLHEVNERIKAAGLQEEFIEWVKPYWLSEYKEGYEKIQGKTMHVKGGPDIPGSIHWAHPDYDAMAFAWAEERGVSTKTLIAGELGPVYGSQWRSWPNPKIELIEDQEERARYMASGLTYVDWLASGQAKAHVKNESIDQISNLIDTLKKNPDSRRAIVSAWNPAEVDNMALPPCHCLFQFYSNFMELHELEDVIGKATLTADYVRFVNERECDTTDAVYDAALLFCQEHDLPRRKLSCQLYQRSADVFLGVPFNIASYALLTMMIAQVTNHVAGDFIWTGGDCHLYANHNEQVELLLTRKTHPLPTMKINPEVKDIFSFKYSDFTLENYQSNPPITAPVAV